MIIIYSSFSSISMIYIYCIVCFVSMTHYFMFIADYNIR